MPEKDGLLLRIRVPGGLIEADQLRTLADLSRDFADGFVEITSRANIQIRAVRAQDLDHIVEAISRAGLFPSPQHDRVRNIVTSPIAGLDEDELIDPRPLVQELDRRLWSVDALVDLHPKFGFAIYGGGRRFSQEPGDISISAVRVGEATLLQLTLAGTRLGFAVSVEHAVDVMLTLAKTSILLANEFGVRVRVKQILEVSGALDRMLDPLSQWLTPCGEGQPTRAVDAAPLGVYPTKQPGRVGIVPCVPLGRLTAQQARCVAALICEWNGDLRLASWRGVVLASVPQGAADKVVGELGGVGLLCGAGDGYYGIAACAGITGCDASLMDVRRDAVSLAQRLAGHPVKPDWTVNFSGCAKQCARRHGATADLIATPNGYDMSMAGRHVGHDCPPGAAIDAVVALHENLLAEVAIR